MKVDYEELMGYYKAFRYGHPGDGEYEDAIESIVWMVPDIVKEHEELEAENADLKKHCEWLEQNLNLKNAVVDDLKREVAALQERY